MLLLLSSVILATAGDTCEMLAVATIAGVSVVVCAGVTTAAIDIIVYTTVTVKQFCYKMYDTAAHFLWLFDN